MIRFNLLSRGPAILKQGLLETLTGYQAYTKSVFWSDDVELFFRPAS